MALELSDRQLDIVHDAMVREYNRMFDKRHKWRPSVRALMAADRKMIIDKIKEEMEARQRG